MIPFKNPTPKSENKHKMETKTRLMVILLFIYFSALLFSATSSTISNNITLWCNQTPHSTQCRHFMTHNLIGFAPKHKSEFRKLTIQTALESAINAQKKILQFESNCQTLPLKAVWSDCLELYGDTVHQLNQTLQGLQIKTCTNNDAQTWLSAALTNLETCRTGSLDLNVLDFIAPVLSSDLSKLIINSLAVNGEYLAAEDNSEEEFPNWLARSERRLLQSPSLTAKANLVVAKDGSGNFKTVQAALQAAVSKRRHGNRFIIHVKRGVYRENIFVAHKNNDIWLVGDGLRNTIIASDRSVRAGYSTLASATAGIVGPRLVARGITFSNTAGPEMAQAVAVRSASDQSVFYRCGFEGYQDTLYLEKGRQFYRECYIYGTIDFICGDAAAVFQNCNIYVRRPLKGQYNVITAQARSESHQNTGIAIQNSHILPADDLKPVVHAFKTYLGRPWKKYSRMVILKTYLDGLISPEGWSKWGNNTSHLDTLYYGEYKNFGPGSSTTRRVKWKGFHVITSIKEASHFSVGKLIGGHLWLPSTNVPFKVGL